MTNADTRPDRPVDLASVRRAAGIVGVGEPAIWRAIRKREIPSYRDGEATRVSVAELRAWNDPNAIPPVSADRKERIRELFETAIRRQARARG